MLCSFHYAQIIIGFRWFLTAMVIYPSIWVAPSDFQQGENSRIIYVHVLAARMSLLIYIASIQHPLKSREHRNPI